MTIKLFVQDQNEYGNPTAAREVGVFATRAEALAAAQNRVDAGLKELFVTGIRADDLFRQWSLFGEDLFLVPDEEPLFSAFTYAKVRSNELTQQP